MKKWYREIRLEKGKNGGTDDGGIQGAGDQAECFCR